METLRKGVPRLSLSGGFQGLRKRLRGGAFLIAFKEELRADDAVGPDNKCAGMGNAAKSLRRVFVADSVRIDRFAPGIRQKRIGDGVFGGKAFERGLRIVTDRHDLAAARLNLFQVRLQFDQLLLAEWSPISRAIEHKRHRAFLEERVERNIAALVVFEGERGSFLPYG